MIIGIGSDIIDIRRIEKLSAKFGTRFEKRVFSAGELVAGKKYSNAKKFHSFLAKRFAAKEAVAKALGTGIGKDISFKEAEVSNLPSGKPTISLNGRALDKLKSLNDGAKIDISLSDDYPYAQAFVIISS